jgi:bacterioferritin-associated ferredoxin
VYVCVCNTITSEDLNKNPELIHECGTKCGKCLDYIAKGVYPGTNVMINNEKKEEK